MESRTTRTVRRLLVLGLLSLLYGAPIEAQSYNPPDSYNGMFQAGDVAQVTHNIMVPMRDGTLLSTDVYVPAGGGQYPAILIRDPYDNGSNAETWEEGLRWAKRGYAYVHQNVRGRFDSEGSWYPYLAEANDGHDMQNWIGQQPWSDGQVGTYGNSYLATTQWKGAEFRSPYLKAMIPRVTPFNYYFDTAYPGGALALGSRIGWASGMGGRTGQAGNPNWDQVLMHLPLLTMGAATGQDNPWWRDFVNHPVYDSYWQVLDSEARLPEFDVPSYNQGGWYDVFLAGTLVSYTGMVEKARSEHARSNQKLLIGPWPHAGTTRAFNYAGIDFGPQGDVDYDSLNVKWFDAVLQGEDNGFLDEPPVTLFIMGENKWHHENEWPLARTQYTNYYFHSGGNANSSSGDGTLSTQEPGRSEPVDEYVYDPRNPVPTSGGNLMFGPTPPGPFDHAEIETRDDVLVFSTPPLTQDVEVTGPLTVTLYAATSARDTDFTAKLVDVHPDGKVINLADGILRGRYHDSPTFTEFELLTPGTVYQFDINLWATGNLFLEGHQIRVEISSSNFPKYDRNLNTGNTPQTDTEIRTANQTIYHNAQYPSHITLPVIPR